LINCDISIYDEKVIFHNDLKIFTRRKGECLQFLFEIGEDELFRLKKFSLIEFQLSLRNTMTQILLAKQGNIIG
jgi:hypothetical protein